MYCFFLCIKHWKYSHKQNRQKLMSSQRFPLYYKTMPYNLKNNSVVLLHLCSKFILGMNNTQHPLNPWNFSTTEVDSSTHTSKCFQAKQGQLSLHIPKLHNAAELYADLIWKWGKQGTRTALGRWESMVNVLPSTYSCETTLKHGSSSLQGIKV